MSNQADDKRKRRYNNKKNPLLPLKNYYKMYKENELKEISRFSPRKIERIKELFNEMQGEVSGGGRGI